MLRDSIKKVIFAVLGPKLIFFISIIVKIRDFTMQKSEFNRYSLKENQLKKVLIRIDYSGVTLIDKWVDEIKTSFIKKYFAQYFKRIHNNAQIDLSNIEDIAESLSIPISELVREPIHSFTEGLFPNQENQVQLDITGFYTTLSIDCIHYNNLDIYIDFITELITLLLQSDNFIQIKRVGIRKIGGAEFDTLEDIYNTYEKETVFCQLVDKKGVTIVSREYTDRFLKNEEVKVNYTRLCRNIRINGKDRIQVILDMDGYVDQFLIADKQYKFPEQLHEILSQQINDYLFELFKDSVTEKYLNNYGHI